MPPHSNVPQRDLFPSQGKGDADRSPGWRDNYPEINWPGVQGLEKRGAKLVKRYGAPAATVYVPQVCSKCGLVGDFCTCV